MRATTARTPSPTGRPMSDRSHADGTTLDPTIPADLAERIRQRGGSATIYDVADLAGVNPSTVSRALSKPGRVSAPTTARIQAAADRLNFRINPAARALQTG